MVFGFSVNFTEKRKVNVVRANFDTLQEVTIINSGGVSIQAEKHGDDEGVSAFVECHHRFRVTDMNAGENGSAEKSSICEASVIETKKSEEISLIWIGLLVALLILVSVGLCAFFLHSKPHAKTSELEMSSGQVQNSSNQAVNEVCKPKGMSLNTRNMKT